MKRAFIKPRAAHSLVRFLGRLAFGVGFISLYLAEGWVSFVVFLIVLALWVWYVHRLDDGSDAAATNEEVVSRAEAARLMGRESVIGLLVWGDLVAAQLPSGEMGVTLSSVQREMEWQECATRAKRFRRLLLWGFGL